MSRRMEQTTETPGDSGDWAQPIVKEKLSDRACSVLRDALMRGQLKPGQQMRLRPTSARFGISPTPMREALLRLVFERALVLDARGTVTVPHLTYDQLVEIRSIRVDLEGRTAAAAALAATKSGLAKLEAIQAEMRECLETGTYDRAIDINTEFHLSLCRMGNLPITYDLVKGLWVRCGPILSHLYDTGMPANWVPHPHDRIIKALHDKDPEEARQAIQVDIEQGGQGLLDYVKRRHT